MAEALESRPDIEVEVGGHTDGKGSDSYNAGLSDRRAKSVKTYLTGKGIAPGRMTSVGYGELQPIATNETDEGREINRRVELKVTKSDGGVVSLPPDPSVTRLEQPVFEPESAPPPAAEGGTSVSIVDYAFSPATLTVPAGTTVKWTNQDGTGHNVSFDDQASDRLKKSGTFERSFDAPGIYAYSCTIHPSMTGTIVVE